MAHAPEVQENRPQMSQTAILLRIFFATLLARWIYALLLCVFMGNDGLKGVDSGTYAAEAQLLAESIRAGVIHGSHWLGDDPYIMPLFQWLTTVPFLLFGNSGAIAVPIRRRPQDH
jgi:hypothetical protein